VTSQPTILVDSLDAGAIWRVRLATPKANLVDMDKSTRLTELYERAARSPELHAIVIEGEGPHFSYGASVQEHLPGQFEAMIPAFHRLFHAMLDAAVPTIAAVRGQCLGGGLELAAFCHRVIASPDAKLGQPEIALGVFAPVASVFLSERVGRGRAEELCLTGRTVGAAEALRMGLVDAISDDPGEEALAWTREYLLPRSASSLRLAVRALRAGMARRFRDDLEAVERIYLDELMDTADAREGLVAFLEKRDPAWSDR
jgi:cyclohexa-1,5-dienecarbonyl-CoA hydratase